MSIYLTIVRLIRSRISNPTFQAQFPTVPEHNRCFNVEYLNYIIKGERVMDAFDLFETDFRHLLPAWQLALTGKLRSQWVKGEMEQRYGKS